jgi:hypothetical protein
VSEPLRRRGSRRYSAEREHIAVGEAHADLAKPVLLVDGLVQELGAAVGELGMEGVDVLHPDIDVEQVRRNPLVVRARLRALNAADVKEDVVASCVAIVEGIRLLRLDLEAEPVAKVSERSGDVGDHEDGRVTRQAHAGTSPSRVP